MCLYCILAASATFSRASLIVLRGLMANAGKAVAIARANLLNTQHLLIIHVLQVETLELCAVEKVLEFILAHTES